MKLYGVDTDNCKCFVGGEPASCQGAKFGLRSFASHFCDRTLGLYPIAVPGDGSGCWCRSRWSIARHLSNPCLMAVARTTIP